MLWQNWRVKSHLFTSVLLKYCSQDARSVYNLKCLNGSKYTYLRVKTLRNFARKQSPICTAELCQLNSSTNSKTHLATCQPYVLQKNLEHAALIPSQTLVLIQFTVWNTLWLFYLTVTENAYYGLYRKPSNFNHFKFQSFLSW